MGHSQEADVTVTTRQVPVEGSVLPYSLDVL